MTLAAALVQDADEIDHDAGVPGGCGEGFRITQVGLNRVDLPDAAQWLEIIGAIGAAAGYADAVSALRQGAHDVSAEKARPANDGNEAYLEASLIHLTTGCRRIQDWPV